MVNAEGVVDAAAPVLTTDDPMASRRAQMFPVLDGAQIERVAAVGRRRAVAQGEVLFAPGDRNAHFHVVLSGALEVVHPDASGEQLVTVHGPGEFTGEAALLTGRAVLVAAACARPAR